MNRRRFIVLMILLVLLAGCKKPQESEPVTLTALHIEEGKIFNDRKAEVVLRGMSTHGLGWYPRYANANALATLKQQGANVIRLAMYSDANEGYLEEPYNLDFVYMGIENAISQSMYVIVDWHILKDANPLQHQSEAVAFFEEIAAHYGTTPNIIYEICNEPNGDTTWEDIRAYADTVIPTIRKYNEDALIIVGTPEFSTRLDVAMKDPLPYDNLLYAYHKYIDVSKQSIPEYYWLEQAVKQNFPVIVSEWGIAYGKDSYQQELTKQKGIQEDSLVLEPALQFLTYMQEHSLSWCGWSLSNDPEIHSAIRSDCEKLSGWMEADLTPGGKLMFEHFALEKEEN